LAFNAMTTTPSGRALALPRASAIAKRDWRASSSDALPYADDAEDERRREVDRLVAEEVRLERDDARSRKSIRRGVECELTRGDVSSADAKDE